MEFGRQSQGKREGTDLVSVARRPDSNLIRGPVRTLFELSNTRPLLTAGSMFRSRFWATKRNRLPSRPRPTARYEAEKRNPGF